MFEVEDGHIIAPIDRIIATLVQFDDIIVIDKITVEATGLKKQALTEIGEYICELLSDYSHEYRERWEACLEQTLMWQQQTKMIT